MTKTPKSWQKKHTELHRFGFNGKENDNEVKGTGNEQDYGARIYDPRLGRFLSIDPLASSFPDLTPYQFAMNMPIAAIDLDGAEAEVVISAKGGGLTKIRKVNKVQLYQTACGNLRFTTKAAILADGSPSAYAVGNKGNDDLSNAGHNIGDLNKRATNEQGKPVYWETRAWYGLVTDNWMAKTYAEQKDGNPLVGPDGVHYISVTSYNYAKGKENEQSHYVNTDIVPVAVLPKSVSKEFEIELGDLVYMFNEWTQKGTWGLFLEKRDEENTIGEVDGATATNLAIADKRPRNGGQDDGITYVFYKNTSPISKRNFNDDAEANAYLKKISAKLEKGEKLTTEDRQLDKPKPKSKPKPTIVVSPRHF